MDRSHGNPLVAPSTKTKSANWLTLINILQQYLPVGSGGVNIVEGNLVKYTYLAVWSLQIHPMVKKLHIQCWYKYRQLWKTTRCYPLHFWCKVCLLVCWMLMACVCCVKNCQRIHSKRIIRITEGLWWGTVGPPELNNIPGATDDHWPVMHPHLLTTYT